MHAIFSHRYKSWSELECAIEGLESAKSKGDAFEDFVFFYIQYFADIYQITQLYCPVADRKPFPRQILAALKLEKKDHGVDGVYTTSAGTTVAWQAKFRTSRQNLSYTELATFWTEAEYADYRLIVSNSNEISDIAHKKSGHLQLLVDKFLQLDTAFFDTLHERARNAAAPIERPRKTPRDYQEEILTDLLNGFSKHDKGKLIAACGIGKTMLAFWLSERLGARTVIFLAPSLQLVRQTLQAWAQESAEAFRYICVCSDDSVISEVDSLESAITDLDIPVTTAASEVHDFLTKKSLHRSVVFTTYHSAPVVAEACKRIGCPAFDLAVYDEAHRTAGVERENTFSQALSDDAIPARKKLFMTATERLVRPRLQKAAEANGLTAFSMSDASVYGTVLHRMTFGQAIKRRIISDYRIVVSALYQEDIASILKRAAAVYDENGNPTPVSPDLLYKQLVMLKSLDDLGIEKVITFHSKISEAKSFASLIGNQLQTQPRSFVSHINGSMSAQHRAYLIEEFERSSLGVITNVRCLTEGIDVPLIDAVFFADPKGSLIDIVQAAGRAMRQPYGSKGKLAYIVLPVLLDAKADYLSGDGFEALFNLIQALRDQDEVLTEWIDSINLSAVTGKKHSPSRKSTKDLGKLIINLPKQLDFAAFSEALLLKIADVNRDPVGTTGIGSTLGKNERGGSYTRVFKTLCDYTPQMLEESLLSPTFALVKATTVAYPSSVLRINNNNISHCVRMGLLKELNGKRSYGVTPLGALYKRGNISIIALMRNQMLKYCDVINGNALYPYRLACQLLSRVRSLGFIEFVYGLYSIQFTKDGDPDIDTAIAVTNTIRERYPNIHLTNEANKPSLLEELNTLHPAGFSYQNVWTDRTTTGNQFRYLIRHLELYSDVFCYDETNRRLQLKPDSLATLNGYLRKSGAMLAPAAYDNGIWING